MSLTSELERRVSRLEKEVRWVRRKMKRVAEQLELADNLNPLSLPDLLPRDHEIIKVLMASGRDGLSTTGIAKSLNYNLPETSGRTIVYRRLRRIAKISQRKKGFPILIRAGRQWRMNFDDFSFITETGERVQQ